MRSALATMRRWLRRMGIAAAILVILAIVGFGVLQTSIGRDWLSRALVGAASGPGVSVVLEGLDGLMPFEMTARSRSNYHPANLGPAEHGCTP